MTWEYTDAARSTVCRRNADGSMESMLAAALPAATPIDEPDLAASLNAQLDAQILALEAMQTPRRMRDAALTPGGAAWLAGLEAQIAGLRATIHNNK